MDVFGIARFCFFPKRFNLTKQNLLDDVDVSPASTTLTESII